MTRGALLPRLQRDAQGDEEELALCRLGTYKRSRILRFTLTLQVIGLVPNYPDPPVHEVILDLKFKQELGRGDLERLPQHLGGTWSPTTVSQVELGPGGAMRVSEGTFAHWLSEEVDDCKWITRLSGSHVTMNSVRPGVWPTGSYVGWPVIREKWSRLLQRTRAIHKHPIGRCGLRYINKLAIPAEVGFEQSLTLNLNAPAMLRDEVNFQFRNTWSSIRGFEELAATIVLAKLPAEQLPCSDGYSAAVLDIDVFNYRANDAPSLDGASEWFDRAHAAENAIFEACVANGLRERLMREQAV